MEDNDLFDLALRMSVDPRSVFFCYGWDDDAHRRWVHAVADELRRRGFLVALDSDFSELPPEKLLWMAIRAKNIVLVISQRFMETCLTGKIPAARARASSYRQSPHPPGGTPVTPCASTKSPWASTRRAIRQVG